MSVEAQVFVSAKKGQSYILPGRHGYQRKMENTSLVEARMPARIRFRPVAGKGFFAKQLASKDGIAKGVLTVKRAVQDCHERGWVEVTDEEVYKFLRTHPDYGRQHVSIEESADDQLQSQYIVPEPSMGEHAMYCTLCDAHLSHRGRIHGHESSRKHRENVRQSEMEHKLKLDKAVELAGPESVSATQ